MNKKQKFTETGINARRMRQGRTKQQVENNYKVLEWTFISFFVFVILTSIGRALAIW